MDSLLTTGQLAQRLATTIPRIHRAVKAGLIVPAGRDARGRLYFDRDAERVLRQRWGSIPRVDDLSRSEVRVLAALDRRPNGLRTVRAVARAAGLSPTAASHALESLRGQGLVRHRRVLVPEGEVREVDNWSIAWQAPQWHQIAPAIRRIDLLEPPPPPRRPRRLPKRLGHLFWDVNISSVDPNRSADFVIARILEFGDPRALAWLVQSMPPEAFQSVARKPGRLKPEVRRLARALSGGR